MYYNQIINLLHTYRLYLGRAKKNQRWCTLRYHYNSHHTQRLSKWPWLDQYFKLCMVFNGNAITMEVCIESITNEKEWKKIQINWITWTSNYYAVFGVCLDNFERRYKKRRQSDFTLWVIGVCCKEICIMFLFGF